MSLSEVGYLIPVNQSLEEEGSVPKLPITDGTNVIGRNSIPVPDKRLSRKHLTLTASRDGSANLLVEGANPIVVNSGNKRRKLNHKEEATICSGDVIELIPGHHLFKYQVLGSGISSSSGRNNEAQSSFRNKASGRSSRDKVETCSQKQGRNADARKFVHSQSGEDSSVEAIRNFHVPNDQIPSTFRLLRVQGLPPWANTSCVSIGDVIQGDILVAILSNYMVDIDWLIPACPALSKVPHVLVIHGESDGRVECIKRSKPAKWILHKPSLPISFGTHHSKAMLLIYPQGVRVIVHTANLIYVDWNNKSQGLWMQDFPWKDQNSPSNGSGFENDLVEYLSMLKWPEFSVKLPSLGSVSICPSFFRKFDYSDARVRLIASVPGYHSGSSLKRWGHMKLRSLLQECTFDEEFKKSPLVYQFSSLGSLDEKWMTELASSMSAGLSKDKTPLGMGEPQIIWPTVEDVRCSLEGYAAGSAVPSPLKNVEKAFLKKYWAKWKADHTGRGRAMPHIKTFARYNNQNLAWFLLTSANLSKAAWGALQKNNTQLMIRSYELGVLFLPSSFKRRGSVFSCTCNVALPEGKWPAQESSEMKKTKLVTLTGQKKESMDSPSDVIIRLPLPYELPPLPYSSQDVPWSWDRQYKNKDVYGHVWPRM
ncbi:tyrosyl-DNA phosphodiesterase 1 isoform X1 [Vigna unguiculata]|uniref:Tyrosyl-DNA phosphodiesterase 1 n=1 Tax=Vigna unguiculata TaxID=3917 RepID=A0A4D6LTR9_VIGUN|nr:tyrosyl-DNA phosphodiesterase 1 isoform X1 [Vigna unguiculata]QCD91881.1 tyrosyl-DNA phosphodiesterase 1 [Vigna unguiculata]